VEYNIISNLVIYNLRSSSINRFKHIGIMLTPRVCL
jgi:hypothetical protein